MTSKVKAPLHLMWMFIFHEFIISQEPAVPLMSTRDRLYREHLNSEASLQEINVRKKQRFCLWQRPAGLTA